MQNFWTSWSVRLIRMKLHYCNPKPSDHLLRHLLLKKQFFAIIETCCESLRVKILLSSVYKTQNVLSPIFLLLCLIQIRLLKILVKFLRLQYNLVDASNLGNVYFRIFLSTSNLRVPCFL